MRLLTAFLLLARANDVRSYCTNLIPRTAAVFSSRSTRLMMAKPKQVSSSTFAQEGTFWTARHDTWRPTVNDVERISWGKPAKKKGTGSRGVPHRLNQDERFLFDQARTKGFLEVGGSGWRSQRRDAPLINSFRSVCDARAQASIVLHKGNTGIDDLAVDISTLRNPSLFEEVAAHCLELYPGGEILFEADEAYLPADDDEESNSQIDDATDGWDSRPIYQLPPYCIVWSLERSEAKKLGKQMAGEFNTAEGKKGASKKPTGVKSGKSRRHGGYGIG